MNQVLLVFLKKRILLAFLLSILMGLFSISINAFPSDLLYEIKTRLQSQKDVLRGEFTQQKKIFGFTKLLLSQGEFVLSKTHGIIWHTLKPFDSSTLITANKIVIKQNNLGALQPTSAVPNSASKAISALILSILTGNIDELDKQFFIEVHAFNKQSWTIWLSPKDMALKNLYTQIQIEGDSYIKSVLLDEKNGDSTYIKLNNVSDTSTLNSHETEAFIQ